ncbi:hypothetical protein IC582_024410 [Cucumis melo]
MIKIVGTLGPNSRFVQVISACLTAAMLGLEDGFVVLTPNQELEASLELLPINYGGLSKVVKKGDTPFLGQYLFTGSETSVWLEVFKVKGDDVGCVVKNSATLVGTMYSLHASEIHIDLPTLDEKDKE